MKVYTQCSKCGKAHLEFDEKRFALSSPSTGEVGIVENCDGFKMENLTKTFGRIHTVEDLAVELYHIFHGDHEDPEPWEPYRSNDHDEVVDRFRAAAQMVYAIFDDGRIGGVYR